MLRAISILSAGLLAALAAPTASHAQGPALPQSVAPGARLAPRDVIGGLPNGPFAVLFLLSDDAANRAYCLRFYEIFEDSLTPTPRYQFSRWVYFPSKRTYAASTLDCAKLRSAYDPLIQTDLRLKALLGRDDLPDGAVLMLIEKSGAAMTNMGFLEISSTKEAVIKEKIGQFNDYYVSGSKCWVRNKEIEARRGALGILAAAVSVLGGCG